MIHRPPDADFDTFKYMTQPEPEGMWILKLFAFVALGAAMSGIISSFRGWSSHSHID